MVKNSAAARGKTAGDIKQGLNYLFLSLFAAIYVVPFAWMICTALKTKTEMYAYPMAIFPQSPTLENFTGVFSTIPFLRYVGNSLFVSLTCVIGYSITAAMVAYAMSKVDWFGRKWLFPLIVGTMMIPSQVTMIPLYLTYRNIGAVGTFLPLVLPAFFGGPYYIFLLRQFFLTIPDSLAEAARIDGAGDARIFVNIILPLCIPAMVSIGVFAFMAAWGDFFNPMLYLNKQSMYTVSLGLNAFLQDHRVEWGKLMAASTMFTIPTVILFFFAQKSFIEGISITGIKG